MIQLQHFHFFLKIGDYVSFDIITNSDIFIFILLQKTQLSGLC